MRRNLRPTGHIIEKDVAPATGAALLTVYSRENCPLCDDMLQGLRAHGYEAAVVDVDSDTELRERYGAGVPVLCHIDTEICRYHLDISLLQAHLATH